MQIYYDGKKAVEDLINSRIDFAEQVVEQMEKTSGITFLPTGKKNMIRTQVINEFNNSGIKKSTICKMLHMHISTYSNYLPK